MGAYHTVTYSVVSMGVVTSLRERWDGSTTQETCWLLPLVNHSHSTVHGLVNKGLHVAQHLSYFPA